MKKYTLKPVVAEKPARINYAKALNSEQYQAVTQGEGPVLVLAGPGSGKTRTLIYRTAYLLEKGIPPDNILLVTFTNKAAREMSSRIELLLKYQPKGLWGGTFHHIGNLTLRKYTNRLDYSRDFGILDREDSRKLVGSCIDELGFNIKERKFPKPAVIESIINFAANNQRPIDEIVSEYYECFENIIYEITKIADEYAARKKDSNNMDYDDLLTNWLKLLKEVSEARDYYTRKFRYILVDEYQDTNRLQYKILKILSSYHKNILVVGDDAQSIYSFRAADIRNILNFPKEFPDTKIFRLETNYRSTPQILNLANESINHNKNQFPKHLISLQEQGGKPVLVTLKDIREQAVFVAQRALELRAGGIPLNEMAVLFRTRYQAAELELELLKRDIPYIIRGGVRYFEQAHIKDTLAFTKILVNPKDELSWKRALCLYSGIGRSYSRQLWKTIEKSSNPLQEILSPGFTSDLPKRASQAVGQFANVVRVINKPEIRSQPSKVIQEIVGKGYKDYVVAAFQDAPDRLQDLEQLANFANSYKSIKRFLSDINLHEDFKGETMRDSQDRDEYLTLTTIHQAKGLEWKVIILIGLCDGQFPHPKAVSQQFRMEEERRLFYVAITRAKTDVYLTYPILRYTHQEGVIITKPSQFIQELPQDIYESLEIESNLSTEKAGSESCRARSF